MVICLWDKSQRLQITAFGLKTKPDRAFFVATGFQPVGGMQNRITEFIKEPDKVVGVNRSFTCRIPKVGDNSQIFLHCGVNDYGRLAYFFI